MRRSRPIAIACLLAGAGAPMAAQTPPAPLDAAARRAVIDTIAVQVERTYVDADTGRLIAARLRDRLRAGVYDTIPDGTRLARLLTADLRAVNGDLHMSVTYAPGSSVGPFGAAVANAERLRHFALGRLDVLPGNVGYMEVTGFSSDDRAKDAIVGALRYLETTDAMIIDVRRNNGGSPALVNFLLSHFTGPDTLPAIVSRVRGLQPGSIRSSTQYTLAAVPGPRRPDVPLFVLTSRGSLSAAEGFAFVAQNLKRATIVGDRTGGAGHNVTFMASGHGFQTTISFSRVSDPRTGREWERVGVQPDVQADAATALDAAHGRALEAIAATADAGRQRQLRLIAETVEARLHPRAVPASTLARYAGVYEGNRRVTVSGTRLLYETSIGVVPEPLLALSDSTFALASQARLVFEPQAGGAMRIRVLLPDGNELMLARLRGRR